MKILFVSSGNSKEGISPITKRQGESLITFGANVHYYTIKGNGFRGYLGNCQKLKESIKTIKPDIVHAHYSLSAYLATIAGAKPLVVSLMGSDLKSSWGSMLLIKFLTRFIWDKTIVKSEDMGRSLGLKCTFVIPNGVNTDTFYLRNHEECQRVLGWDLEKKHILFAANPSRQEKNYTLAEKAFALLKRDNSELHPLVDVQPDQMPFWFSAADVVLLTSLWEGSPNVIKEAMACNRPIVATDVGDIRWLFGNRQGHYLAEFCPDDVANMINMALEFSAKHCKTKGREQIFELGLDSDAIAHVLMDVYHKCLSRN